MLNSSLAVGTYDLETLHALTQQRAQVCSRCFLTASPAGQGGATAAFGLVISKQTSVLITGAERQRGRGAHQVFAKHRKPTTHVPCKWQISNKRAFSAGQAETRSRRAGLISQHVYYSCRCRAAAQHRKYLKHEPELPTGLGESQQQILLV